MEPPEDTPKRSQEATIMAALDTIWREVENSLTALQDDGKLTGPTDKKVILRAMTIIDLKVREIRDTLMTSGEYSSFRKREGD